jgi:hypothetical protein
MSSGTVHVSRVTHWYALLLFGRLVQQASVVDRVRLVNERSPLIWQLLYRALLEDDMLGGGGIETPTMSNQDALAVVDLAGASVIINCFATGPGYDNAGDCLLKGQPPASIFALPASRLVMLVLRSVLCRPVGWKEVEWSNVQQSGMISTRSGDQGSLLIC